MIRYKVYGDIQRKVRAAKSQNRQRSNPNMNDSVLSTQSLVIGEDDLTMMIKDLDIDAINKDVFNLYEIQYGLDPTLALRKVQVTESEDEVFQNYLECLKEAHDRLLSYIFQGHTFGKMQENPMHSKDLQHGVPYEFNNILDELLDGVNPSPMMNEEEYNRQMNLSLSQIPPETPSRAGGDQDVDNGIQERLLTEVEEGKELSTPHSSAHYESSSTSKTNSKKTEKANHDYPSDLPVGSPSTNYARGVSIFRQ